MITACIISILVISLRITVSLGILVTSVRVVRSVSAVPVAGGITAVSSLVDVIIGGVVVGLCGVVVIV